MFDAVLGLTQAGRLLRVLEMVHKERQRFQRLKLDNARAAPKRNLREQWMGPESKFYNDFHDVFGADGALRRELEPCVSEVRVPPLLLVCELCPANMQ